MQAQTIQYSPELFFFYVICFPSQFNLSFSHREQNWRSHRKRKCASSMSHRVIYKRMGLVQLRHTSHENATQSSHSIFYEAVVASQNGFHWIPLCNAHGRHHWLRSSLTTMLCQFKDQYLHDINWVFIPVPRTGQIKTDRSILTRFT